MTGRIAIALLAALVVTAPAAAARSRPVSRVVVVVMENKDFDQLYGSPEAPYLNRLANRYVRMERFFGVSHPSLPNYLALLGGSTFGVQHNCTDCGFDKRNLVDQLNAAGVSWRAYMQGMPRPCFDGPSSGAYAKRHNPFMYFESIVRNRARCRNVVPGSRLRADERKGRLPRFVWVTPDTCFDSHNCSIAVGDRYLSRLLPPLLRRLGPRGFLVLTYDEGLGDAGCCGGIAHGGQIPTVIAGPDVRRGRRIATEYSLYSILRTIEDAFALRPLKTAAAVEPLEEAFRRPPRLRRRGDH